MVCPMATSSKEAHFLYMRTFQEELSEWYLRVLIRLGTSWFSSQNIVSTCSTEFSGGFKNWIVLILTTDAGVRRWARPGTLKTETSLKVVFISFLHKLKRNHFQFYTLCREKKKKNQNSIP